MRHEKIYYEERIYNLVSTLPKEKFIPEHVKPFIEKAQQITISSFKLPHKDILYPINCKTRGITKLVYSHNEYLEGVIKHISWLYLYSNEYHTNLIAYQKVLSTLRSLSCITNETVMTYKPQEDEFLFTKGYKRLDAFYQKQINKMIKETEENIKCTEGSILETEISIKCWKVVKEYMDDLLGNNLTRDDGIYDLGSYK